MKIERTTYQNEGSRMIRESGFKIGDPGFIFDLVIEKLYSEPERAICREIASNARDAHREAGKSDVPIQIWIPTKLNPELRIKDFGPGISPDRIDNVYTGLGNSTKRDSNLETGGFGLGAKTPFAYTSQFTIKTISKITSEYDVETLNTCSDKKYVLSDVIDKNILCLYIASKGAMSGQAGAVKLVACELTHEETGTEINVPVAVDHIYKFVDGISQSTKFWNPRPEIKGVLNYNDEEMLLNGEGWLHQSGNIGYGQHIAIIDGIQYPISSEAVLKSNNKANAIYKRFFISNNFFIYFNNGEIELTPSRENVLYTEKTISAVKKAFDNIFQSVSSLINDKISGLKSYYDAATFVRSISQHLRNGLSLNWNNNSLDHVTINIVQDKTAQINGELAARLDYYYEDNYNGNTEIKKSTTRPFNSGVKLFVNDIGAITPKYVIENIRKSLDSNTSFYVLVFRKFDEKDNVISKIKETYNIDINQISFGNISKFKEENKPQVKTYTKPTQPTVKRISGIYDAHIMVNGNVQKSKLDTNTESGYYIVAENRMSDFYLSNDSRTVPEYILVNVISYISDIIGSEKVWVVNKRTSEKLGSRFVCISEAINKKKESLDLSESNLNKLYLSAFIANTCSKRDFFNNIDKITISSSLIDSVKNKMESIRNDSDNLNLIFKFLQNLRADLPVRHKYTTKDIPDDLNIDLLFKEVDLKYPLLSVIGWYNISENKRECQEYVNLIDSKQI